jgi:5-deoxy-D-glucuronate isomerase
VQVSRRLARHNVDASWLVRDRSFGTIPMGYHPVVGEPGVHVSYVWAYLVKKKEWEKI